MKSMVSLKSKRKEKREIQKSSKPSKPEAKYLFATEDNNRIRTIASKF